MGQEREVSRREITEERFLGRGTDRWWGVGGEGNRQRLHHEIEMRGMKRWRNK